jgi:hypothetical protein
MLYENQLNKYSKDNFLDEWLRYINKSNIKLMCCDEKYYYLCNTCSGHYKRKKHIYIFHQFCDIPKEINSINNYYDINQFTLINMYCNTLKKPGFSYWHLNGQINLSYKKLEDVKGTFGLILNSHDGDLLHPKCDKKVLKKALVWLKNNNLLYQRYLANFERIDGYFDTDNVDSYYKSFPVIDNKTKDIQFNLNNREIRSDNLIINVSEEKSKPLIINNKENIIIGQSYLRNYNNNNSKEYDYITDHDIEGKLFPHLFPDGKGFFVKIANSITLAQYFRNRLLNYDPRWRNDRYYVFYAYDRLVKERIYCVNNMVKARTNLMDRLNTNEFAHNDYENYYKYGSFVPKCITGSKAYWKSKYYDLMSMINEHGNMIITIDCCLQLMYKVKLILNRIA